MGKVGDDQGAGGGRSIRLDAPIGQIEPALFRFPCAVDPEDQAAAFEDGWFRSGDLMEVHDGRVTVLGRLKASG